MKTIYIEKELYNFEELSEKAKERARWEYLDLFRTPEDLQELCEEDLRFNYDQPKAKVSFRLGRCQSDFFEIENTDLDNKTKTAIEKQYMKWGYDYFEEVEDEEIIEVTEMNGYWFEKDGTLYGG